MRKRSDPEESQDAHAEKGVRTSLQFLLKPGRDYLTLLRSEPLLICTSDASHVARARAKNSSTLPFYTEVGIDATVGLLRPRGIAKYGDGLQKRRLPSKGDDLVAKAEKDAKEGKDDNIVASDYYDAMKAYQDEGNIDKANEIRKKVEKMVAASANGDFADELENQAKRAEGDAKNATRAEGKGGSTEILAKAAYLRVKAAYWLEFLANRAFNQGNFSDAAAGYKEAAEQKALGAKDLENAAALEPKTDAQQKEAKKELADAGWLRHDSASLHRISAKSFGRANDSANKAEQEKAEAEQEKLSDEDKAKSK
jgi:hypothetical protein